MSDEQVEPEKENGAKEPTPEEAEEKLKEDEPPPVFIEIPDVDRDSLHILPLSIIPFETKALRKARLIKNAQLDSVVELFRDKHGGSGQMDIEVANQEFGPEAGGSRSDMAILSALGNLHSYDVYSMRVSLRDLGIKVNDVNALKLSESKMEELSKYMKEFTRSLILEIYGKENEIQSFEDLIRMFANPDVKQVHEKLQVITEKLGITLNELPDFLEDYGDVYLSLSYYKHCLLEIEPTIKNFQESALEIHDHPVLKHDLSLMKTCRTVETMVNKLLVSLTNRFESFEESTRDMWDNISGERFRTVEAMIKNYHTTIGGELCSLSVKMDAWRQLFPNPRSGGPARRADFIMTEMRQGIEKIKEIEQLAPKLANQ